MGKADKRLKKVDVRKKRRKLIKEGKIKSPKKEEITTKVDDELNLRLKKETRLYWVRTLSGGLAALIGRLIGLVGWFLLIWMLCFWFLFPFFTSFVIFRYKYDKESWNWKNIIMPGIGIYFFIFLIIGTIIHTFLLFI